MSAYPPLTPSESTMLMRFALGEAERALTAGNLPIGAVVAIPGEHGLRIVGRTHEQDGSGSEGHAVRQALRGWKDKLRPGESEVVVVSTVEPCEACMDLVREALHAQVIFGLTAPTTSGVHRVSVERSSDAILRRSGVMANECRAVMSTFVERGIGSLSSRAFAAQVLARPLSSLSQNAMPRARVSIPAAEAGRRF